MVLAAVPDPDPVGWRILHDFFQTAGALLIALAVGGGLIRWLQEREWRQRTYEQAYDLLSQAMLQTALVADQALTVLDADDLRDDLDILYRLPYGEVQRLHADDGKTDAMGKLVRVLEKDAGVADRARQAAPDLELRADKVRELALELGPYLQVDPIALSNKAARLHRRVRSLLVLSLLSERPDRHLAGLTAYQVLTTSNELAANIGVEYAKLRERPAPDAELEDEIRAEEQRNAEDDEWQLEHHNLMAEFERSGREMDAALREASELMKSLQEQLQDQRGSADSTTAE